MDDEQVADLEDRRPEIEPEEEVSTKNRMPENLKKHLLKLQGGKVYLPVAFRVVWFRDQHQDWGIHTEVVEGGQEAGFCTVKASILDADRKVISSGHKTETRQDFPAGWVEKAETGAVGRALALCGYGTQFGDDLLEGRPADAPLGGRRGGPRTSTASRVEAHMQATGQSGVLNGRWEGPGQCPKCHAPEGKYHGKPCVGERVNA